MRLIDADALMEDKIWLFGAFVGDEYSMGYMEALDKLEEVINKQPTVEPVRGECFNCSRRSWYQRGFGDAMLSANKWIPCSERLPEKAGKYLVTIIESGSVHTSVRRFNPKPKHPEQNEPIFTKHLPCYSGWERATKGVIAWMPLPAPSSVEE